VLGQRLELARHLQRELARRAQHQRLHAGVRASRCCRPAARRTPPSCPCRCVPAHQVLPARGGLEHSGLNRCRMHVADSSTAAAPQRTKAVQSNVGVWSRPRPSQSLGHGFLASEVLGQLAYFEPLPASALAS
jgi:hypothetical protein